MESISLPKILRRGDHNAKLVSNSKNDIKDARVTNNSEFLSRSVFSWFFSSEKTEAIPFSDSKKTLVSERYAVPVGDAHPKLSNCDPSTTKKIYVVKALSELSKEDKLSPSDAYVWYSDLVGSVKNFGLSHCRICFLAAALGLPQSNRRELLPLVLKGDNKAYFAECFRKAAGNGLLTYDNFLSALKMTLMPHQVEDFCKKNGLKTDHMPEYLPDFDVILNDRDKALSQPLSFRDASYFTRHLQSFHLAWALDCIDLLQEAVKELAVLKSYKKHRLVSLPMTRYLLLEKIFEKKQFLLANEVIRALLKPSLEDIFIDPKHIHQALYLVDQLTGIKQLTNIRYEDIYKIANTLSLFDLKTEKVEAFSRALGLLRPHVDEVMQGQSKIKKLLVDSLYCAYQSGRANPGNIVFALGAVFSNPKLPESDRSLCLPASVRSLSCLEGVASCELPSGPIYKHFLNGGATLLPYGSVPITMEILSNLPLNDNCYLICILMGLGKEIFSKLEFLSSTEIMPDFRYYYLASKLSEPDRQLETGALYRALDYLGDEYALSLFPDHLKGEPSDESGNNIRHFHRGKNLISMVKALVKDKKHVETIGKTLGLDSSERCHLTYPSSYAYPRGAITYVILMMFFSYDKYSLKYIAPFIHDHGEVADIKTFIDLKEPLIKRNTKQYEVPASKKVHFPNENCYLRRRISKQSNSSMSQSNLNCEKDGAIPVDGKIKYS